MSTTRIIALSAVILIACCGCGGTGTLRPSDVVKKYYGFCNVGDYSRIDDLLSVDAKRIVLRGFGDFAGGVSGGCARDTRERTYTGLDIKTEEIRDEVAIVIADIHYKDKNDRIGHATVLIKEGGVWKLSIIQSKAPLHLLIDPWLRKRA